MTTPREPPRGPFEERKQPTDRQPGTPTPPSGANGAHPTPADTPASNGRRPPSDRPARAAAGRPRPLPGGARRPSAPPPPKRVKPAWYRRPLPELPRVRRRPLLVGLAVLVVAALAIGLGFAFSGDSGDSGDSGGGAVADPTTPATAPSAARSAAGAAAGTAFPVVQESRQVGTVTLLGTKSVSMVSGTPPTAAAFVAFEVRFDADGGSLYTSPLEFTAPGASDGPVLNGGAEPGLQNTGVPAGQHVTAWVTIQAPRHGTLGFTSDPSKPASQAWRY